MPDTYKIVAGPADEVMRRVSNWMEAGWVPHGSPQVYFVVTGFVRERAMRIAQAMIRATEGE